MIGFIAAHLNWLQNFINKYSVLAHIAIGTVSMFCTYLLNKRAQIKINEAAEKIKHDLQRKYLYTEIRAAQLFSIYSKLFSKFKAAESIIFQLRGPVNRQRPPVQADIDKASNVLIIANDFLAYNLLFVTETTADIAIRLKDLMGECLWCEDEDRAKQYFSQVEQELGLLKDQMEKELGLNAEGRC